MRQDDVETQVGGMSRAVMLVLRFRALALILFLVITGALCLQLRNIKATSDPVTPLIPPRHPFATTLQAIEGMNTLPETLMVIVEVKTRAADVPGPEAGLTRDKRFRLARLASRLQERPRFRDHPVRIDAVAIVWPHVGDPEVRHYEDAF